MSSVMGAVIKPENPIKEPEQDPPSFLMAQKMKSTPFTSENLSDHSRLQAQHESCEGPVQRAVVGSTTRFNRVPRPPTAGPPLRGRPARTR